MHRLLAAGTLAMALAASTIATAQPMPPSGTMPATPAVPADPAAGMPATPAGPAIPADSAEARALPSGTETRVNNTLPPPPPEAMNKTYPVCTRGMMDNCQNPGEGGAPGRSRASKHRHHHGS